MAVTTQFQLSEPNLSEKMAAYSPTVATLGILQGAERFMSGTR